MKMLEYPLKGDCLTIINKKNDDTRDLALKFMLSEVIDGLKLNEVTDETVLLALTGLRKDLI